MKKDLILFILEEKNNNDKHFENLHDFHLLIASTFWGAIFLSIAFCFSSLHETFYGICISVALFIFGLALPVSTFGNILSNREHFKFSYLFEFFKNETCMILPFFISYISFFVKMIFTKNERYDDFILDLFNGLSFQELSKLNNKYKIKHFDYFISQYCHSILSHKKKTFKPTDYIYIEQFIKNNNISKKHFLYKSYFDNIIEEIKNKKKIMLQNNIQSF